MMPKLSANRVIQWFGDEVDDAKRESPIGIVDFQQPWFLKLGWERSRFVALIPNLGTCFLINNSIIMTNWHVLRRPEWAAGKKVVFDYEQSADGTMLQYTTHSLNPAKLFFSNEPLDYAVCYVDGEPGAERGFADIRSPGSLVTDTRINIIQHPGGELKKIAIRNNGLKYFDEQKLQYWTDTEHGSSGSPLFNDSWQIVGLHYLNDTATDAAGEKIHFNVGIPVAAILASLQANGVSVYE